MQKHPESHFGKTPSQTHVRPLPTTNDNLSPRLRTAVQCNMALQGQGEVRHAEPRRRVAKNLGDSKNFIPSVHPS